MRLESDLLDHLEAVVDGTLEDQDIRWREDAAACVVMASAGYPGAYEKGKVITGLDAAGRRPGTVVFHAGTARGRGGDVVTAGGRVLGVASLGADIGAAVKNAYAAVGDIAFEGRQYRTDIGRKALD
jgi:phosphoribosylamine--glycine ligase